MPSSLHLTATPAHALGVSSGFLLHIYPWMLIAIFTAWAAAVVATWKTSAAQFKPLISIRGLVAVAVLSLGFYFVRAFVLPPRHQVYFDEFAHEDIAANVARDGTFGQTEAGGTDALRSYQVPAWPGGYHVLLGGLFKIAGYGENVAFDLSAALGTASLLLMFLLVTILFRSETTGILAAFLLAAMPIHVRYAGAADLTACSEFWILSSLLTFALYLESRTLSFYALMLLSVVYACNVRTENVVLVPFVAAILARERPWRRSQDGFLVSTALAGLLLTPMVLLFLSNRTAGLAGYSNSMTEMIGNEIRNGTSNVLFIMMTPGLSLVLLPVAVWGVFRLPAEQRKRAVALLALGLGYLVVCSLHMSADFGSGAYDHLALPTTLLIAAAAAAGLASGFSRRSFPAAAVLIGLAFVGSSISAYRRGPLPSLENEYRLVKASSNVLPADAIVITLCPPLIRAVANKSALSPLALSEADFNLQERLGPWEDHRFIVFKDFWWYSLPEVSDEVERDLGLRYKFKPIATMPVDGREYGFYALVPKS